MRRLINFFILFKEYVALGVIVLVSFALMAVSKSEELQPLRSITAIIVGSLQTTTSWIPDPFFAEKPAELRERNILLTSELARLRRAQTENEELRKLLNLKPRPEWKLLPTEIIGKTTSSDRNMLTISNGENDGIRKGMAVITDAGLVGRVFATSGGYALVEDLFNHSLRVSVKVARSRVDGILTWESGDQLIVRNVPKALDVQVEDVIVSSEYSTLFPAEVPIGVVTKIESEPNSLFRRILVKPYAHPFAIEHCYVIVKDVEMEKQKSELEQRMNQIETKKKPKTK